MCLHSEELTNYTILAAFHRNRLETYYRHQIVKTLVQLKNLISILLIENLPHLDLTGAKGPSVSDDSFKSLVCFFGPRIGPSVELHN